MFLPAPPVTFAVTTNAKRNQVAHHIATEPAPGFHVMDLQAFHGTALLTPPAISLQDPDSEFSRLHTRSLVSIIGRGAEIWRQRVAARSLLPAVGAGEVPVLRHKSQRAHGCEHSEWRQRPGQQVTWRAEDAQS